MGLTLVGCDGAAPPSSGGGGASSGGGSGGSGSLAPTPESVIGATCAGSPGSDTEDGPDAGGRNAVSGAACIDWRDETRGAGWRRPPALLPMTWSMIGATPETPTESVSCAPAAPLWVDPLAAAAPPRPP